MNCLTEGCPNEVDYDDHPYYCGRCQQKSTFLTVGLCSLLVLSVVVLRAFLA